MEALLRLLLRWSATTTWRLLLRRPLGGDDCDRLLPLHRRTTMLHRCSACLVVTIYDLLLISILGWHGRSSASVAHLYNYSSIRDVLRSSWSGSCAIVICDGYKGLEWIATCDRKISLCSLSVMCATCLYGLESPSGLTVHIVSRLSQQIEVIYSDLLLINVIDLMKFKAFWIARIWVDLINPMRFS
jgi:hypothetical protein